MTFGLKRTAIGLRGVRDCADTVAAGDRAGNRAKKTKRAVSAPSW